jgi:DNA-binding CsgD family transcriptional regulator
MDLSPHWEAILQVVHGVSLAEDLDEFGPRVLDEIEALIPSDQASFNEVDPIAQRAVVIARPRSATSAELELWQRWSHQNPSLMYMLQTGDGSAKRISDFIGIDELHALELYVHVYGPLGIEYQLAVGLPAPRPVVIGIALNRSGSDFTDDEVAKLNALRPHLVQAYRHAQLITEHRNALHSVTGALENDGRAFHALGEPVSGAARSLLSDHFACDSERLPERVRKWVEREQASFRSGDPDELLQPLISTKDGRRLTVRFVPGGRGPDLLWLIERPFERDSKPLQRLGLSEREAEVLWFLTKGQSTKEIARHLAISTGTVKKHLEHVYRKLGVANATAAVAQAFDALTP